MNILRLFVDNNIYEDFLIKEITNDNLFSIHLLNLSHKFLILSSYFLLLFF